MEPILDIIYLHIHKNKISKIFRNDKNICNYYLQFRDIEYKCCIPFFAVNNNCYNIYCTI